MNLLYWVIKTDLGQLRQETFLFHVKLSELEISSPDIVVA